MILSLISYKYSVNSLSKNLIRYKYILSFDEDYNSVSLYRKVQLAVHSVSLPYLRPVADGIL